MEPFAETAGVADTWWRDETTMIAIYRGEALPFADTRHQTATIYTGITESAIYLDY